MTNINKYCKIDAKSRLFSINFKELYAYKDLFYYLVKRDIRATTHSTQLGIVWSILQPLLTVCVMSLVMGSFVRIDTKQIPYPLFALSGFMIWSYFSTTLLRSSSSMSANSYLITKIYFPRIIIPLVPVVSCSVELLVMLVTTLLIAYAYGIHVATSWSLLFLTIPISVMLAAGFGLLASSLTSKFKDFGHIMPVILQIGMYVSPVFYPIELVPEKWLSIYSLNPLVNLFELVRAGIMNETVDLNLLIYPTIVAVISFCVGIFYFTICENEIADTL
jgi:lipopolysaccharide transport system permease protein